MSNKPLKKSERRKLESKNREKKPRARMTRQIGPGNHLIVTEGTKTEPNYFEAVRERVNNGAWRDPKLFSEYDRVKIEVVGTGKNTIGVFEAAKHEVEVYREREGIEFNHVWIAYDRDDFPKENVNAVVEKCASASDSVTTYHALWSNQCIELWFLLHFEYIDTDMPRKDYAEKITQRYRGVGIAGRYRKNDDLIFEKLFPYLDKAVLNARRLLSTYPEYDPPASKVPATAVFELLDFMKNYF